MSTTEQVQGISLLVKRLSYNVYDCFFGTGWDGWTRVVVKKTKEVIPIKGRKLSDDELSIVKTTLTNGSH
jgi:hypothetical protein